MDALDPDILLAQAAEAIGLNDLGPDDVRAGLTVYTASLREEADLSELGTVALASALVTALSNRLRVVAWHRDHPEVDDEVVEAPLVVVGMFRAGTTLLSNLLDRDPGNRSLLRWESLDSAPPSTPTDHREGPRVDEARVAGDMLEALNPAMRAIHHEDADGPTECVAVMSQDMRSLSWEAIANVDSYGAWLRTADMGATYRYHRRVLQVLQSGGVRGRWTLKSPHHALALDALIAVYPNARLVMLHRDPVVLAASVCSLIATLSGTFSDADHTAYIAEHWTQMLEDCVARTDAFRAAHPDHPITDVQYLDLVADPLATIEALYGAVGDELSGPARDAMADLVATRPKGSLGTHGYDLASHGLEEGALRERFAGYVERHRVAREAPPA